MRSCSIRIILLAFVMQVTANSQDHMDELTKRFGDTAHAQDLMDEFVDKFIDKLFTRALVRNSAVSLQSPGTRYHPVVAPRSVATDTIEAPVSSVGSASSTKALWTKAEAEKVAEWEPKMTVNEAAKLSASDFAIKPEDLIMKAKIFLAYDLGVGKPDLLSKDFEFVGPVVGPLSKDAYVKAVGGFNLADAFPDMNNEFHHFRVDPFEPNRVWFTARGRGTNTGKSPGNPLVAEPSGKAYVQPPQSCSLRFEPDGEVNQFTIGYVMDRRIGNTGGLGGVYGIMYAMGKPLPFPEANPWKPSKRYRFFNWIGQLMQKAKKKE